MSKAIVAHVDIESKAAANETNAPSVRIASSDQVPSAWLYKRIRFGSWTGPFYASPIVQLLLVSFTFFLCPGMYNALSGLGGGGQLDATVANNATVALYSTFATVAFFSGSICNKLGVKITLCFGGLGYVLYIASFLSYNHTQNAGFVIFAGAILGISAALLWAAQSVVMVSYPQEGRKGRYIGVFWMIFNLGAVIGSLVPLIQTVNSNGNAVGDSTYVAFLVLTAAGTLLALTLCNADKVVRNDGSKIIVMKHPTWKTEITGLFEVIKSDTYIIALFPMFFASNYFYTYQFNDFNLALFNIRTRALNSLMYWVAQIIGAWVWGTMLDVSFLKRRTRAVLGLSALFLLTMGLWGGGLSVQLGYTRKSAAAALETNKLDWTSPQYGSRLVLYFFYGFFDAVWQTYIYWLMGAISNNSRKLAIIAGFYKGIQSAGAAIIFRVDALKAPYMSIFASTWGLLAGGLLIAAPVVGLKVTNHTDLDVDLKFSDETVEDVHMVDGNPKIADLTEEL